MQAGECCTGTLSCFTPSDGACVPVGGKLDPLQLNTSNSISSCCDIGRDTSN